MAKADVTKIDGYESMTPEQKVAALEQYEFDDKSKELEKAQNAVSKANSEAAEWKRKHNLLLSDEEQKKAAADEEKEQMAKRIAELEKREVENSYKSHYIGLGYDAELAASTAKALVDTDMETVFANQKKFLEAHDKTYKAQLMTGADLTPASGSASVDATASYEKLLEQAKENGDGTAIAYYTRVIQQSKQNK